MLDEILLSLDVICQSEVAVSGLIYMLREANLFFGELKTLLRLWVSISMEELNSPTIITLSV